MRTRNYGQGGGGYSETEVLEKRRLMTADEVKQLSPKRILVFVEGVGYAVLGKKIFYYQDAYFKKRLLPPPPVSKLNLSDVKATPITYRGRHQPGLSAGHRAIGEDRLAHRRDGGPKACGQTRLAPRMESK